MRITHVVTDLGVGGAQVMLQQLVMRLQAIGVRNTVISLGAVSPRFDELPRLGVDLERLGMRRNVPSIRTFMRLRRLLKSSRPDVVHTWLYHADLLGGLAARSARVAPVVWGLHHTPDSRERLSPVTRAIMRVNARLSSVVPSRIICCAPAARASHAALGYVERTMVVITNGFDADVFRPQPEARVAVRAQLGLPAETPVVGLMARFHPQKDHRTFVRAAALMSAQRPAVHFILAGRGVDGRNPDLRRWMAEGGVSDRCHLLGVRDDVPRLMAACDLVTSSACRGEAFPLVLGEAMSCGVPCVTTDVGDSAALVGDAGIVVAPRDADALATAWGSLLGLSPEDRRRIGERGRARVMSAFSLAACAREHLAVYEDVAGSKGESGRS